MISTTYQESGKVLIQVANLTDLTQKVVDEMYEEMYARTVEGKKFEVIYRDTDLVIMSNCHTTYDRNYPSTNLHHKIFVDKCYENEDIFRDLGLRTNLDKLLDDKKDLIEHMKDKLESMTDEELEEYYEKLKEYNEVGPLALDLVNNLENYNSNN